MGEAIHAPVVAGHGHGASVIDVTAIGVAIGAIVGVALALAIDALADDGLSEIGPFFAPTEMCRFNTFIPQDSVPVSAPQQAVPSMVSRCDHLFQDRQYIQVGYRI